MAKKESISSISRLTENIHVWPDFHGNRSPLADPSLLGMVIFINVINAIFFNYYFTINVEIVLNTLNLFI